MKEIIVPQLGESINEATISKLKKKKGEFVKLDEALAELETDKVTMEINSNVSGVIKDILCKEGDNVQVGKVIILIDSEGVASVSEENIQPNNQANSQNLENKKEIILSPAAAKIAAERNIMIDQITATGKDGRVTKSDILSANNSASPTQNKPDLNKIESNISANETREERVKMSKLRKTIAERLKESQNTAAILTSFNEVDMSAIIEIRTKYKDLFEKKYNIKLGFMSFFVKASIYGLKEIASINAEIRNDEIIYKNYYDIGVAVGTEQGLVVPIIRDADKKTFAEIEKEIAEYGKKAKEGKLTIKDLTGGSFTISNGGVYGSLLSTPIINPPQSGILGMHKTQERPVVINGKIEIRPMMYLALSYDHRIIDGKEAVTFLVKIKEIIASPERLLFGV